MRYSFAPPVMCIVLAVACGGGAAGSSGESAAEDMPSSLAATPSASDKPTAAVGSAGAAATSSSAAKSQQSTMQQPRASNATSAAGSSAAAAGAAGMSSATAGAGGVAQTSAGAAAAGMTGSMSAATCDRACLTGFNDSYLDALVANDASKLKTSSAVRFTENGKELKLGEGLWAVARALGPYRQDMAEVPAGQTAGFVSLTDDSGDVLLAFRLKVENAEVTEIETTVCRSGEATFFSPAALMHNDLYDKDIAPDARMDREALTKIVDSYFAAIESSDGSMVPFAETARRNENGSVTGMGSALKNVAMFSYIEQVDRRYVLVDVERGNVLPWVLFQIPMGITGSRTLHLAELFKVDGGKIMDVQAIMVNQPLGTPGGWD